MDDRHAAANTGARLIQLNKVTLGLYEVTQSQFVLKVDSGHLRGQKISQINFNTPVFECLRSTSCS